MALSILFAINNNQEAKVSHCLWFCANSIPIRRTNQITRNTLRRNGGELAEIESFPRLN